MANYLMMKNKRYQHLREHEPGEPADRMFQNGKTGKQGDEKKIRSGPGPS